MPVVYRTLRDACARLARLRHALPTRWSFVGSKGKGKSKGKHSTDSESASVPGSTLVGAATTGTSDADAAGSTGMQLAPLTPPKPSHQPQLRRQQQQEQQKKQQQQQPRQNYTRRRLLPLWGSIGIGQHEWVFGRPQQRQQQQQQQQQQREAGAGPNAVVGASVGKLPPMALRQSSNSPTAASGLRALIQGIRGGGGGGGMSGPHPRRSGRGGGAGRRLSRIGTGWSRTSRLTSGADGWEVLDDYYTREPSPLPSPLPPLPPPPPPLPPMLAGNSSPAPGPAVAVEAPGAWQVAQHRQAHATFMDAAGLAAQPSHSQQQEQQRKKDAADEEELQWQQPQDQQQLGGWPLEDAEAEKEQQQQQQQPWGGCVDAHGRLRELPPPQRCPDADALAWEQHARQKQQLQQQQEQYELQVAAAEGNSAGSDGGRYASIIPLRVLRPKK
jgi:hypothetical protein